MSKPISADELQTMRHSCAHLMAAAVQKLWPGTRFGVGPATERGFYYDMELPQPLQLEDLEKIEQTMRQLAGKALPIERKEVPITQAIEVMDKAGQPYKVELLNLLRERGSTAVAEETGDAGVADDGEKAGVDSVSFYSLGDFTDLCRGPHVAHSGKTGAFKLMALAGAYWRGKPENPQLQRIHAVCFATQDELDFHLHQLAEAERRDHRRLGRELGLFHIQEEAVGSVFWHPKGWTLWLIVEQFIREQLAREGYVEVKTPQLLDRVLWEKSGHWEKFRANMFTTQADEERVLALKPMSCPCHVQIFKQGLKSYRDLPIRMAEFGACHRNESSGSLHGIMRTRAFVQDDAHIFCTPGQVKAETIAFCDLLRRVYAAFGYQDFCVKFSDRPPVRAGSDEVWDKAEAALKEAVEEAGLTYTLNPGEGAFYGPKLEFVLRDAIGRDWQCGTYQLDFVIPERLEASYIDEAGDKIVPVMIHRAILGSFERFLGVLIEHHAGAFPLWLAPVQAVVVPIADRHVPYARQVQEELMTGGLRVAVDDSNERMQKKIREAEMQKIPYILVVGDREAADKTAAMRLRSGENMGPTALDAIRTRLIEETTARR
ncbi:MAG: threonine--tRNA ligase [Alphaproteobacteria bacterium]|nr:MAG: threonine--tRNA ligase [Alphaproteobacteria bacterium]